MGAGLSLRDRMSGDRAFFSTGSTALLTLCVCVCVCVHTHCVFGHGGQPRRTVCIRFVLKDVICPHVGVVQTIAMSCYEQRNTQTNQCDNVQSSNLQHNTLKDNTRGEACNLICTGADNPLVVQTR